MALPLASITRAPSALCRATTSAVEPTSVIRSPSSTTAPSNRTSFASFIVTTQPFLMMMRSVMAVTPCSPEVEDLPAEDGTLAQRAECVLDAVERVAPSDGDAHRPAGRHAEGGLQVQPGRGDCGHQSGLGQDELDGMDVERLVGVAGGHERPPLGQAPDA